LEKRIHKVHFIVAYVYDYWIYCSDITIIFVLLRKDNRWAFLFLSTWLLYIFGIKNSVCKLSCLCEPLLGALTKLRKATISLVTSVSHGTTRLPLDGFSWNLIF